MTESKMEPIVASSGDEVLNLVSDIKRAKDLIKTVEKQQKLLEQKLYNYMKESEELVTIDTETGEYVQVLTWKTSADVKFFDAKRFESEKPKVYAQYMSTRPGNKRLLIK